MAKLTTSDLANLSNPTSAVSTINSNFQAVENAMENTLSRDGTSPNTMSADFDMNNNQILNLPEPVDPTDPVRLTDIDEFLTASLAAQAAAEAAQAAAEEALADTISTKEEAEDAAIAAQAAQAAAEEALDDFDDKYLGSFTSDPLTDNDGDPLDTGDLYFNSVDDNLKVYDGALWVSFSTSSTTETLTNKTINLTNNTLTGTKTEFNTALSGTDFVMQNDLGSGVLTFLGTPSSANLKTAITDETGSGALVFADTPTLVTPVLGAATATSVSVGDDPYAVGWNGSTLVPTKNAVYDKIETLQPLDSDLTAIAAISPSNDDIIQRKAGAWTNRTMAQLISDLAALGTTFQPLDSDLTDIAALTTTAAGRSVLTVTDDNLDEIVAWDDSAGTMKTMALADLTTEASAAAGDYVLIYGAEGDLRKADWNTLPGAAGNANAALSNLASVAINTTLVSDTDNTDDLGTSSVFWKTGYFKTSIELGSTDTTLARNAAGVVQVEGNIMPHVALASTWTALQTHSLAGNLIRLVNTTDNASVQTALFEGDRATMAANDEAYFSMKLSDSAGNQDEFARITWKGTTVTSTTEAGRLQFGVVTGGSLADEVYLTGANFYPATNDGNALGLSGTAWSDLFLASGGVINFNAGDITMTHSTDALGIAGGTVTVTQHGNASAGNDVFILKSADFGTDKSGLYFKQTNDVWRILVYDGTDNNATIEMQAFETKLITSRVIINAEANDGFILDFKSSDIAHGVTNSAETDTFGFFQKFSPTGGGLILHGIAEDTNAVGLALRATGDDTTTKSTGAGAPIQIQAWVNDGTATQAAPGANSNLVAIKSATTTRFIMDADGDSHQDVGTAWTNFDHLDDIQTLNALAYNVARENDPIKVKFGEWLLEKRDVLEAQKLVTFSPDGHHFVNMSKLTMLHTGALRQIGERMDEYDKVLLELKEKMKLIEDKRKD